MACINAGVGLGGLFWETDLEKEMNMVNLNCASTVHLAKYVVRQMVQRRDGQDSVDFIDRRGNGGPARGGVCGDEGVRLSFAHSLRYELKDTA